jgi:hypothetical protein
MLALIGAAWSRALMGIHLRKTLCRSKVTFFESSTMPFQAAFWDHGTVGCWMDVA